MRILHVINTLKTGGAEKLMTNLLPKLQSECVKVDLLVFDGSFTPFRRALEDAHIHIIDFGQDIASYNPLNILRIRKHIMDYDIIHTHNYAPQLFGAIASIGTKAIMCTTEHSTSNRRRTKYWFAAIDKMMYSRYNRVICISDKARSALCDYIKCNDEDKFITIDNGIEVSQYMDAPPLSAKELGAREDSDIIIQVARFGREKDQGTIIRAMKYLPQNLQLVLVGDGIRRSECELLAKNEGVAHRVHFLGIRTDIPRLMRTAKYVAVSSHIEGFGLAAVEGMAAGNPVVACDIDGLREVVQGAGVLFPHQDSKKFAEEILRLECDEKYRTIVSKKCVERAWKFDISTMAEKYMNVYMDLKSH